MSVFTKRGTVTDSFKRKNVILASVAAAAFIGAVVVAIGNMNKEDDATKDWVDMVWYYDLNTDKLFPAKAGLIPPIDAPSGPHKESDQPAGVKAHVLGCNDCSDSNRFIAWLEAYPPKGVDKKTNQVFRGHTIRVAKGEDKKWWDMNTDRAKEIRKSVRDQCKGEIVKCYPENQLRR